MPIVATYTLVAVTGTALMLTVAGLALRRRPAPGATSLAALALGVAVWSLATLLQTVGGPELSRIAARGSYLGITLAVLSWFVLTVEYAGRERYISRRLLALLCVQPVLTNALVWTNESHHLFWQSVRYGGTVSEYEVVYGPGFWLHAGYSYLLVVLGIALVFGELYRSQSAYRGQWAAMLLGVPAPMIANGLWLTGRTVVDWTPIGFAVTAVVLYLALRNYEFVELTPVARDTVVDRIPSGVAVIDPDGRITDVNATMTSYFDADLESLVGEHAGNAFDWWRETERGDGRGRARTYEIERDGRHFQVEIEPFADDLNRPAGRIVLVHDVTEREQRERELQRQNEQLDRFADVLTHDLRNPLNVADGRLTLLEETHDFEHVDQIKSAHERMGDLIEDVRTLVRDGQTVSDTERLEVARVARTAATNVDTRRADVRIEDDVGVVEGDETRLLHAFENLFRNAVEHGIETRSTDQGDDRPLADGGAFGDDAAVTIRVGRITDGRSGFFVADDGPGITADERETVFESGYTTGEDGTGLGLAIVKNAVQAHGWEIDAAESDAGGARFEITDVSFCEA